MKDFLGQSLNIGDSVIMIAPNYRHFVRAKVTQFTTKQVRVAYMNTWHYAEPGYPTELLQQPNQLTKIVAEQEL